MRSLIPLLSCALLLTAQCRGSSTETDDEGGGGGTGGGGGEGPVTPKPLKILNWNVKNLIDDVDDGAQFEDFDDNWEEHVSQVANVLGALDADVVVLQEVEHESILGAVVAELGGDYVFHRVIDGNDPRGIDVGVISKIEPDDVVSHRDDLFAKLCYVEGDCNANEFCDPGDGVIIGQCQPDDMNEMSPRYRFARDALEIRITFNGRRLVLLGVHYKSKENDDPDKRLAEAQRARTIADSITADDPEAGVIILGDFNDLPDSPALNWSLGSDPVVYQSVADQVPQADRWTFNFQGTLELVDHQIGNALVYDMLDTSSVRIVHGPEAEAASDHAPIIATYDVR